MCDAGPVNSPTVLLLGGTRDARELADLLAAEGIAVTTSVAGRTASARTDAAGVRSGGFGGVEGLVAYLADPANAVAAVVDATHPFAASMTRNAAAACARTGTPLVRLDRPGWASRPDAGPWEWVDGHTEAARAASGRGRVLLTVGRQPLPAYAELDDVVARVAEMAGEPPRSEWRIIEQVGPFSLADELTLLDAEGVRVLVSKDSGGRDTEAKLDAAASRGVGVVMVRRPAVPEGVPVVADPDAALAWLRDAGLMRG